MKNKKKYYIYEMNITFLNILSIILLMLFIGIAFNIDKEFLVSSADYIFSGANFAIFIISTIFYMFFHEVLHSLSYILNGAKWSNVIYGVALEKGVLYCLCKQNISKKNILISLMTPFVLIGVLTFVLSFFINSSMLLFMSIFNLSGCAGDVIMFAFISALDKGVEFSEFDNPISFALYSDKDISKIKHLGLNYVECRDNIQREDLKKIKTSTISKVTFAILIIIFIILMLFKNY